MRKTGGILLWIGACILIVWGIHQWFLIILPSVPVVVRIAIIVVFSGLCLLVTSLIRERLRDAKEDKKKFKEVEK